MKRICEACGKSHGPVNAWIACLGQALREERAQHATVKKQRDELRTAVLRVAETVARG